MASRLLPRMYLHATDPTNRYVTMELTFCAILHGMAGTILPIGINW